jgi:hypothetical protein
MLTYFVRALASKRLIPMMPRQAMNIAMAENVMNTREKCISLLYC